MLQKYLTSCIKWATVKETENKAAKLKNMTVLNASSCRRRPSDVATDLLKSIWGRFRHRQEDTRRSLSTGDLVTDEPDFMELNFEQGPTTSQMCPNFDDTDRVPMCFSSSTGVPHLMPQSSRRARKLLSRGITEYLDSDISIPELHRSQPWYYANIDSAKAERMLMTNGYQEGSFLIHNLSNCYQLCYIHNGKIEHLKLGFKIKDGQPKWSLDLDKSFKNLCDLVDYYRSHKGFVLTTKLKNGVARPARLPHTRTRA